MAKDLPYFKFFVSEWTDGDITLENYKTQGVFINICSYYWSKECNISFDRLMKRFNDCYDEIDVLFAEQILKRDSNDNIIIVFLDEQLAERRKTSKKNSDAGKLSALKRWGSNGKVTPVKIPFNDNVTIKKREEKRREDIYTIKNFLDNWNQLRFKFLNTPSNLNKLTQEEGDLFNVAEFTKDEFHNALKGLFKQENIPQEIMRFKPKHFLKNIDQYLDAEKNKKYNLYAN